MRAWGARVTAHGVVVVVVGIVAIRERGVAQANLGLLVRSPVIIVLAMCTNWLASVLTWVCTARCSSHDIAHVSPHPGSR